MARAVLTAECSTLQTSHTFNLRWVCVISLICRRQTETKMQESHHAASPGHHMTHWQHWLLFSDVNSIVLEKQNNWEY